MASIIVPAALNDRSAAKYELGSEDAIRLVQQRLAGTAGIGWQTKFVHASDLPDPARQERDRRFLYPGVLGSSWTEPTCSGVADDADAAAWSGWYWTQEEPPAPYAKM